MCAALVKSLQWNKRYTDRLSVVSPLSLAVQKWSRNIPDTCTAILRQWHHLKPETAQQWSGGRSHGIEVSSIHPTNPQPLWGDPDVLAWLLGRGHDVHLYIQSVDKPKSHKSNECLQVHPLQTVNYNNKGHITTKLQDCHTHKSIEKHQNYHYIIIC